MKSITVGKVPGTLQNIVVEDNAKVSDALAIAGLSAEGFEIKLNGSAATLDSVVADNAKIFLVKKIKGNQMAITIGKVPGTLQNIAVEDGATVADALSAAGLAVDGFEIKINGATGTTSTRLVDNAKVFLVKKIKGNQMAVTVGKVPGTLQNIAVEDGATVADVLRVAGLSAEGFEIKINGATGTTSSTVSDNAKVFLVKKIKGNA